MNSTGSLRRPRGYSIFVVAAVFALLQPLLTPFAPQLAGWLPGHQHIYVNGIPVDHAHTWEGASTEGATADSDDVPAGFIFHLCDIHPDGLVPISQPSSDSSPVGAAATSAEDEAAEVIFTFDLDVSTIALPTGNGELTPCRGELVGVTEVAVRPVAVLDEHPIPPPPRA